jgi:NitT/TauT family transport system permease protein
MKAATNSANRDFDSVRKFESRTTRRARFLLPVLMLGVSIILWDVVVRLADIPPYVLPGPGDVFLTLLQDRAVLFESLVVTLTTAFEGFVAAALGGVALAFLFSRSKWFEYALLPYAVILQVTPVIAIAPLLLIYMPQQLAVVTCAWIVAFFPVLSNTALGLKSVDRNLAGLFALYGASSGQILRHLQLPSALPFIMGGLRIAGGLSLIGAVVAEIAAGSAGAGSGLAYRIAESSYRLNIPRMFAALVLLSAAGLAIYMALSLGSYLVLRRWHESALGKDIE